MVGCFVLKDAESMCIFFLFLWMNITTDRQCSVCDSRVHTSSHPVSSAGRNLISLFLLPSLSIYSLIISHERYANIKELCSACKQADNFLKITSDVRESSPSTRRSEVSCRPPYIAQIAFQHHFNKAYVSIIFTQHLYSAFQLKIWK